MSATRFNRTKTAPCGIGTPSRSFKARSLALPLGALLACAATLSSVPAPRRSPRIGTLEQEAVRVTASVRPDHVRVGQTAELTIRVVSAGLPPQAIDIEALDALEVLTYADGQSTTVDASGVRQLVLERRFEVRPLEAGRLHITALVVSADGSDVPVPPVILDVDEATLDWAPGPTAPPGDEPRDRILPEGVPPATSPDTRGVVPGGVTRPAYPGPLPYPTTPVPHPGRPTPYGGLQGQRGSMPYPGGARSRPPGGPGGWPSVAYPGALIGGGVWAPTAHEDPWWPRMIPELARHESIVDDASGLVRLGVGVTPLVVFEGQQVTHVATAYFSVESAFRVWPAQYLPPTGRDLWPVDLPEVTGAPAAFRGALAESSTFRRAFFPSGPGPRTISPATLLYTIGHSTVMRAPLDSLHSDPLTVEVLPIPRQAAPPRWDGAVGRYRVEAFLEPRQVVEGQPALLTVLILGAGNVESLRRPVLDPIYASDVQPWSDGVFVEVRDGVVGGVRTFSWLVTPWEPGQFPVGPTLYSFFDPYVGDFGTVATPEIWMDVLPYAPPR